MRRILSNLSPHAQLLLLGLAGLALSALTALVIVTCPPIPTVDTFGWRIALALPIAGLVGIAFWSITVEHLLRPLLQLRDDHEFSQNALAARTKTVDRLLEFSQTIQGAGKTDQIFQSLSYFLRTELSLSGIVIAGFQPDSLPAVTVQASWPQDVLAGESALAEFDSSLCPCLRQNLPRCFKPEASPIRCAIDRAIRLPQSHPAFCIPFSLGRKMQCVVHMLLPPEAQWTDHMKQLAAAYVNTACSSLMSLNLLDEAEQRSMTDPLTQLYNRRSMEQLVGREVSLSERHSHPLAVVMIDMDEFKQVNDLHGHAAGDYMLKAFADCVRITLRRTDLAFRYGGDEFVIVLPQTPLAQAEQVVQKLRQAFAAVDFSSAITNLDRQPTLSVGVVERSKNGNVLTFASLLFAADQALYEAKHSSRNCVKIYEPQRAA